MRTLPLLVVISLALAASLPSGSASAQARELGSPRGSSEGGAATAPAYEENAEGADAESEGALERIPEPPQANTRGVGPVRIASPRADGGRTPIEQAALGDGFQLRASIAARTRAVGTDLQVLSLRGGSGVVDGVLALVMGATTIGIGVAIDLSDSAPGPSLTPYLYVYGGAGVVRGILGFAFMQDPSSAAVQFTHMPMTNLAEVRARLRYGERELESLARNAELARILDGSLSIATGLAVVPIYLGPTNFAFTSAFDYFVLIGAAVSVTTGTITLFSTNEAERRWSSYRDLRDRLLATERGAADDAELERAQEQLEALRTTPTGLAFQPIVAVTESAFFAGASGSF